MAVEWTANRSGWRFVVLSLALAMVLTAGCAKTLIAVKADRSSIDPAALEPGLAVLYFEDFYRHIKQMPIGAKALKEGKPGKPILNLNHRFGAGPVFDSGLSQGVGVQMTGYIRFSSPGRYLFKAKSNDGIRISINRSIVVDDPNWHSSGDRFSEEVAVDIDSPGWYSFFGQYFQRKGTAMLELYWQVPGQSNFSIVPVDAFGHIPGASGNG